MIILGIILLVAGFLLNISLLWIVGLILLIVGLVLILLMAFRPQGMFGKREEMVLGD